MLRFPRKFRFLLPTLVTLTLLQACGPVETPNQTGSTGSGNLDNLSLGGSSSSPRPAATGRPAIQPSAQPSVDPALSIRNVMAWDVKPVGKSGPVSMLVGTVHAPLAPNYGLPKHLSTRLNAAKAFYMEADLSEIDTLMKQISEQVVDIEQNMETRLGTTHWPKMMQRAQDLGLPVQPQIMRFFRPWYLNLVLSGSPLAKTINPDTVMDQVLRKQASDAGVPVKFLESAADQLNAMQAVPDDEHIRLIKSNLDEGIEALNQDYREVFEMYNSGDPARLEAIEQKSRQESALFTAKLSDERNRKWLVTLEPVLKAQSSVIAVGALHMAGTEGLVQQLQARGFEVTPRKF